MTSTLRRAVESAIGQIGQGLYGVACSGGADSMALADATIDIAGSGNVVVLVIDHGLQPETADVAAKVVAWARGRGAAAIVERVVVEPRASIEAAAREARYAALDRLADELGCAAVLLGHTARDQAETVLMRIIRGTGPAGLVGIPTTRATRNQPRADVERADERDQPRPDGDVERVDDRVQPQSDARDERFVRPLLAIDRADIDAYVAERRLPVWDDPMNDDPRFFRTRLRNVILPALRAENPQLDAALLRLANSTSEWRDVIDAIAEPLATFPIDVAKLRDLAPAIRKRAVSIALDALAIDHDATHLDAIDRVVVAPTHGEVGIDIPGARIVRSYNSLRVDGPAQTVELALPEGPYVMRVWRPGDRMRPARLKGRSRKLSDLFVDAKVPRSLRVTARVVIRTTDQAIVWAEHVGPAFGEAESVVPKAVQMGGSF